MTVVALCLIFILVLTASKNGRFSSRGIMLYPARDEQRATQAVRKEVEVDACGIAASPQVNRGSAVRRSPRNAYPLCGLQSTCCSDWDEFYKPLRPGTLGDGAKPPHSTRKDTSTCMRLLLIVIFNSPFFENIPIIEELYSDVVTKIVYYSDKEVANIGVHGVPVKNGFFQHRAISDAMHRYPDYDGYLWIGDDVFWNHAATFSKMNASRVWMFPREGRLLCFSKEASIYGKFHWAQLYGKVEFVKAYNCLPRVYQYRFLERLGCNYCAVNGASDIGYVPKRYRPLFMELAYIFRHVFFELAIPSMLLLMPDEATDIEQLQGGIYAWGDPATKPERERQLWKPSTEFVHPVKLSSLEQRRDVAYWTKRALNEYPSMPLHVCTSLEEVLA